jgi:hypothetical protein
MAKHKKGIWGVRCHVWILTFIPVNGNISGTVKKVSDPCILLHFRMETTSRKSRDHETGQGHLTHKIMGIIAFDSGQDLMLMILRQKFLGSNNLEFLKMVLLFLFHWSATSNLVVLSGTSIPHPQTLLVDHLGYCPFLITFPLLQPRIPLGATQYPERPSTSPQSSHSSGIQQPLNSLPL